LIKKSFSDKPGFLAPFSKRNLEASIRKGGYLSGSQQVDIVSYREKMNQFLKRRIDNEAVYV